MLLPSAAVLLWLLSTQPAKALNSSIITNATDDRNGSTGIDVVDDDAAALEAVDGLLDVLDGQLGFGPRCLLLLIDGSSTNGSSNGSSSSQSSFMAELSRRRMSHGHPVVRFASPPLGRAPVAPPDATAPIVARVARLHVMGKVLDRQLHRWMTGFQRLRSRGTGSTTC